MLFEKKKWELFFRTNTEYQGGVYLSNLKGHIFIILSLSNCLFAKRQVGQPLPVLVNPYRQRFTERKKNLRFETKWSDDFQPSMDF